jgi:hypothetical protein
MTWDRFGRLVAFGLSTILVYLALLIFEAIATDPVAMSLYRFVVGAILLAVIASVIWRDR